MSTLSMKYATIFTNTLSARLVPGRPAGTYTVHDLPLRNIGGCFELYQIFLSKGWRERVTSRARLFFQS